MSKEKLETGAMLNPQCQECSKRDICDNKTLCAYLIPKEIKIDRIGADLQEPLQMPIKLTPEMLEEKIRKNLINKSLEIENDLSNGCSKQSYFKR